MRNYRDHLYTPLHPDNLNEGAMWDKIKGFVGKHKGKLMAGAGLLGGGYLASKLCPPKDSITISTNYEYDPKKDQWYEIKHRRVRKK